MRYNYELTISGFSYLLFYTLHAYFIIKQKLPDQTSGFSQRIALKRFLVNKKANGRIRMCMCKQSFNKYITTPYNIHIELLCFKCCKLGVPTYLSSLLEQYRPTQSLRSSSLDILSVPCSRTKTTNRRFSIATPSV